MLYITLLIYVCNEKEDVFREFENLALPMLDDYNGKLLLRLRPNETSIVSVEGESPYEVHFLSFESEQDFNAYIQDPRRKEFLHLKEESIKATLLVKGEKV